VRLWFNDGDGSVVVVVVVSFVVFVVVVVVVVFVVAVGSFSSAILSVAFMFSLSALTSLRGVFDDEAIFQL